MVPHSKEVVCLCVWAPAHQYAASPCAKCGACNCALVGMGSNRDVKVPTHGASQISCCMALNRYTREAWPSVSGLAGAWCMLPGLSAQLPFQSLSCQGVAADAKTSGTYITPDACTQRVVLLRACGVGVTPVPITVGLPCRHCFDDICAPLLRSWGVD